MVKACLLYTSEIKNAIGEYNSELKRFKEQLTNMVPYRACLLYTSTGPKFAIDAIAAGREGAISLHRYVHEHCTLTIGRNRRDFIELDKENIKVETRCV